MTPIYTAYLTNTLRLTRTGTWEHEGRPIGHSRIIDLFHRSVIWDPHLSAYVVRIGREQATFEVEDTPYFIHALNTGTSPWKGHLLGGEVEPIIPSTVRRSPNHGLVCRIKGGHRARFLSTAYQSLVEFVVNDEAIKIDGTIVRIQDE